MRAPARQAGHPALAAQLDATPAAIEAAALIAAALDAEVLAAELEREKEAELGVGQGIEQLPLTAAQLLGARGPVVVLRLTEKGAPSHSQLFALAVFEH